MSSASSTPVRSRETFSTRAVTVVGAPAGIRGGSSLRTQASRYRDRRAISADTTGKMTSRAPTRTRSGSGIARPQTTAAPPAAMNDRPRVVNELKSPRMAHRRGRGNWATIRSTTCSGRCRSTMASAVGSSRCASTGLASRCTSSGIT